MNGDDVKRLLDAENQGIDGVVKVCDYGTMTLTRELRCLTLVLGKGSRLKLNGNRLFTQTPIVFGEGSQIDA